MVEETNAKSKTTHIKLPKTLVLVLSGGMFGSAESQFGRKALEYLNAVAEEILSHDGYFAMIDGFLSDEIQRGFDDVIDMGLSNAIIAAERVGCLNSFQQFVCMVATRASQLTMAGRKIVHVAWINI